MNKRYLISFTLLLLLYPGMCLAQAPHGVGGFELGKNIADYGDRLDMSTDLPIRHQESLREVEVKAKKLTWFKSGLVTYGTCADSGQIVRIKLKYADSSKKFYETLLKRFKKQHGEPNEWRGDPFHIFLDWKWSFTDKDNNRISLHLQHNTRDAEEKIGNAVKITQRTALEAEWACQKKKTTAIKTPKKKKQKGTIDWELLVPR